MSPQPPPGGFDVQGANMGHPYRQRHENGDFDKAAKQATTTNTGKVKQTTPKTTSKPSK